MRRRTARELTALADATLPPKRRDALLRQVFASPKLTRTLKEQLVAIKAIRRLDTPAPTELHERIQRATREACAAQQSASSTAMTALARARLIRGKILGAPRC